MTFTTASILGEGDMNNQNDRISNNNSFYIMDSRDDTIQQLNSQIEIMKMDIKGKEEMLSSMKEENESLSKKVSMWKGKLNVEIEKNNE
jgi:hypothetical protein